MRVREVDCSDKRDVERFVQLPFRLYRHTPQWVPPLLRSARKDLYQHQRPFFEHSEAAFLVAEEGDRVVGRLAVMENRHFNAYHGANEAFFGFFEAEDDETIAAGLFERAFHWAWERGLTRMSGPRGLLPTAAGGILVEGFEHRPALDVSYDLPYYDRLIATVDFEKLTDHMSGYLPGAFTLPERVERIADRVKERRGYTIRSFTNAKEIWPLVPRVFAVYEEAFAHSRSYYPPTDRERYALADDLLTIADPRLLKLVMKGDAIIGFIFSYHDISAALQRSRGRLWPLGWYWLKTERRRTRAVNVNGAGLLPAYQGLGGNAMLYTELDRSLKQFDFDHIEIVNVDEHNQKSIADNEAVGVRWYKRHRQYTRSI
jgi:hypothetical protein